MTIDKRVEPLTEFEAALCGRRIRVTGQTGFTGGWLVLWLGMREAR